MKNIVKPLSIIIILLTAGSVVAAPGHKNRDKLEVVGEGVVHTQPNQVTIRASIESVAKSAKEAAADNAQRTDSIIQYLKEKLPEKDAVTTSGYNLSPVYEYNRDTKKSDLVGYRVTNQLLITSHQLERIGELLDKLAEMKISNISNLQFTHDNPAQFQKEALQAAIKQGQALAADIASASGAKLGKISYLSPITNMAGPVVYKSMMLAGDSENRATTPIESGDVSFTAQIKMVYHLN